MVELNLELENKSLLKTCFGTFEYSAKSGICRSCKVQEECGKMALIKKAKERR